MTNPSSTAAIQEKSKISTLRVLTLILITIISLICLWHLGSYAHDPFVKETLNISGSVNTGKDLFKMNCVGCHGISAQGLVGPDLKEATSRLNDPIIINQVVKGLTPPMPSFDMDSQSIADLLAYLHSLNN